MIDDLDGALEMDDDGPLMEIAYVYDDWTLMICMDGDGGAHVGDWMMMALEALTLDWWSP